MSRRSDYMSTDTHTEVADAAREIDYREVLDQIEVDAIIIKHETRAMV